MAAFDLLNDLNINGHTEQKNVGGTKLTYLSWPWAWAEVKKRYPDAHYTIWKNEKGLPYTFDPETGYMVYTNVTIEGITHEMWLPVMDGANKAMKAVPYTYKTKYNGDKTCEAATMMDINKTIMRCLVKNLAMFGLGLYIYAGEDLPESEKQDNEEEPKPEEPKFKRPDGNAQANVKPVDTVPKPKNPVKDYIANEITFMKQIFGIADTNEMMERFLAMRKALIEMGLIEDIPSDKQTMEQAKIMIDSMYKNFKPSGEAAS